MDPELSDMSLRELKELRDAVDSAIRQAIARDRVARQTSLNEGVKVDLERERDAWKAMRRQL